MWPENRVIPSDREFDVHVFRSCICPVCGGSGWLTAGPDGESMEHGEWAALPVDERCRITCPACDGGGYVQE